MHKMLSNQNRELTWLWLRFVQSLLTRSVLLFLPLPHSSSSCSFSVRKHQHWVRRRLAPWDGPRLLCPTHLPLLTQHIGPSTHLLSQPEGDSTVQGERWRVTGNLRLISWPLMFQLHPLPGQSSQICSLLLYNTYSALLMDFETVSSLLSHLSNALFISTAIIIFLMLILFNFH